MPQKWAEATLLIRGLAAGAIHSWSGAAQPMAPLLHGWSLLMITLSCMTTNTISSHINRRGTRSSSICSSSRCISNSSRGRSCRRSRKKQGGSMAGFCGQLNIGISQASIVCMQRLLQVHPPKSPRAPPLPTFLPRTLTPHLSLAHPHPTLNAVMSTAAPCRYHTLFIALHILTSTGPLLTRNHTSAAMMISVSVLLRHEASTYQQLHCRHARLCDSGFWWR